MKKAVLFLLVALFLASSLFAATKATEDATLVLNLDEEKFLVGFSSSKDSVVAFDKDEIKIKETVADADWATFDLSFENNVYLYYKAVTKVDSAFNIQLSINTPLRLALSATSYSDDNTIPYTLTVAPESDKWDGTSNANIGTTGVSSPTISGSAYTPNTMVIGAIRNSGNENYYLSGFAKLTIVSKDNSTAIPVGAYKSTITVSIVTK